MNAPPNHPLAEEVARARAAMSGVVVCEHCAAMYYPGDIDHPYNCVLALRARVALAEAQRDAAVNVMVAGGIAMETAAVAELVKRLAAAEALSVTKVMLDIVPGDGDGYEVYAKSVQEVEEALATLGAQVEDLKEQLLAASADAPGATATVVGEEPGGYTAVERPRFVDSDGAAQP